MLLATMVLKKVFATVPAIVERKRKRCATLEVVPDSVRRVPEMVLPALTVRVSF